MRSDKRGREKLRDLSDQQHLCTKYLNDIGVGSVVLVHDRADTAKDLKRPVFRTLLHMCALFRPECVMAQDSSCFTSTTDEFATLRLVLTDCGINLITLLDQPEGGEIEQELYKTLSNLMEKYQQGAKN